MKDLTVQDVTRLDLIVIADGVPKANTEHIEKFIEEFNRQTEESIKNDLDVSVIDEKIRFAKKVGDDFATFRKSFTSPLDDVKKELIGLEKQLKEPRELLLKRKDEMLEATYKIADEAIMAEFGRLQEENNNIVRDMSVFDGFILKQRTVKGMLPNESGVLSASALTKIYTEFEKHVAPIREMQELEKRKASEQKQFDMYIDNLNVQSDSVSELEAVIINLENFKGQVQGLYPNIFEFCLRTIENKIGLAKGKINTLNAIEAQRKADIERQEALEREVAAKKEVVEVRKEVLQDEDYEIITELNNIENGLNVISDDKALLSEKLERLRVLFPLVKYADTQNLAKEVVEKIKAMIAKIKEPESEEYTVQVSFMIEDTLSKAKLVKAFMLENNINFKSI